MKMPTCWGVKYTVRGSALALFEGVPTGPQLNDSSEPNGPLWVCYSGSVQMKTNGPVRVKLTLILKYKFGSQR